MNAREVFTSAGESAQAGDSMRAVYAKAPTLHWTQLDGETVILNLETGAYFTLNAVGSAAWDAFDGKRALQDVVETICDRFAVEPGVAHDDLEALVEELLGEHLIASTEWRE